MIKPTVGRVVWYYSEADQPQPNAAIIAFVWSDTVVNLAVIDRNGVSNPQTSVLLYQGEGEKPTHHFCEWMPYQQGQAAKTEALEKKLAEGEAK